jgi:hypothetical protein
MNRKERKQFAKMRRAMVRAGAIDPNLEKTPTLTMGASQTQLHPGVSAGNAPTGNQNAVRPPRNPIGTPGTAYGGGPSIYNELAGRQPKNTIDEVDLDGNWYSPFQPIEPFGPPYVNYPRAFDYRTGWNLDYGPVRINFMRQLQTMSRSWGILRTVIETRKDQFMRQDWAFQKKGNPKAKSKQIDELNDFFKRPDGRKTFSSWKRMLLEDLFVIDSPSIYKWRAANGKPLALTVIDGATIKPLIDDTGQIPMYPNPAFQQIIKGLPMVNFDLSELLYAPMRPTPQTPVWGYSPVEQIFVEIGVGIKRLFYQNSFWTDGSMPELIITVPEGWTAQQTTLFQAHFDALMAGNIALKSRVRFVPGGMKPFDIKNANGDALKADIDEWWARLICFAFSISPTPFIKQMNRATAESAQDASEEEGLLPTNTWFKEEIMDPIIQEDFGYDDIEFNFTPQKEVDPVKQQTVVTGYVKEGIMTRDEGREQIGLDAMGGEAAVLTVTTATGPVPLEETVAANRAQAEAKPDELDRQQESHEVNIKNQKAQANQPPLTTVKKPPAKGAARANKWAGVGEDAIVPFGKAADGEVTAISRNNPEILKAERALEAAVAAMFEKAEPKVRERVIDGVTSMIGHHGIELTDADVERIAEKASAAVDLDMFNQIIEPAEEALTRVVDKAGAGMAAKLRIEVGSGPDILNQVHQTALEYARDRAAEMVGKIRNEAGMLIDNPDADMAITETTRNKIREYVVKALSPGTEPFDLQGALEDLKDELTGSPLFSRKRAQLIAQAETGMAHNRGTFASMFETQRSTGLVIFKAWTTAEDHKVCSEICDLNADAGPIPLDHLFPSGDIAPLGHPRCRCALTGVVQPAPAESPALEGAS